MQDTTAAGQKDRLLFSVNNRSLMWNLVVFDMLMSMQQGGRIVMNNEKIKVVCNFAGTYVNALTRGKEYEVLVEERG